MITAEGGGPPNGDVTLGYSVERIVMVEIPVMVTGAPGGLRKLSAGSHQILSSVETYPGGPGGPGGPLGPGGPGTGEAEVVAHETAC